MRMPYPQVQYHVHEVEEQQVFHSLGGILGFVGESHFVEIGPHNVEKGQFVLEESVESPVSKLVPEKVVGHKGLGANFV